MNARRCLIPVSLILFLALPAWAGRGYMGGQGTVVVEPPPVVVPPPVSEPLPVAEPTPTVDEGGGGGMPSTVEGPLNDKMASSGKLFGDLYVILRYRGTEVPIPMYVDLDQNGLADDLDGDGVVDGDDKLLETPVGGEPILSEGYGWYASEVAEGVYDAALSPYPSQCVQPVASYERWGDIGFPNNALPMVMTYDATWGRTECAVGELVGTPTANADGTLALTVDPYFVAPGGTWEDPVNGPVTYPEGVLWADLIQEVHFGRLNLSRAPEAVLQAAFDEAIHTINSPDTLAIEIDASGRLLLTKNVYDPYLVDPETGEPLLLEPVKKAIDSPLENLALYVKLLKDGHLVTPGDEREPIDRSQRGGIPLWKMLELEDGPSQALRPTIDIGKMTAWGLGDLVDVSPVEYVTYYQCYTDAGAPIPCLCEGTSHDGTPTTVACEGVASRELRTASACPVSAAGVEEPTCEGPWIGIPTDDGGSPAGADFAFAAAFVAAGADKTGHVSADMLVYLNSILGINKVLGYSEYDADGNPTPEAVDYSKNPAYFSFGGVTGYQRSATFAARGEPFEPADPDDPGPSTYTGSVRVLEPGAASGSWIETLVPILGSPALPKNVHWDDVDVGWSNGLTRAPGAEDILGFTQMADDDLSVIEFIHTYQIPERR